MADDSYSNREIFAVTTKADLAMTQVYLDQGQWEHILLGHREMRSFVSGIRAAVEAQTHVYKSAVSGRFLFASHEVLSRSGRPMSVVVERDNERGKIVTASIRGQHAEPLVYSSETSIYSSVDAEADIFYLSKGQAREAYALDFEGDERLWLRRAEDDDSPLGVTAFEFRTYWSGKLDMLVKAISGFLGLTEGDIEARALAALKRAR